MCTLFCCLLTSAFIASAPLPHHEIHAIILPEEHGIQVTDTFTWPHGPQRDLSILLHESLTLAPVAGVTITDPDTTGSVPFDAESPARLITLRAEDDVLPFPIVLTYSGIIHDELEEAVNYARGFSTTSGLIDTIGVFLTGGSYWLPTIPDCLFSYDLHLSLPEGWQGVSQGERGQDSHGDVVWHCRHPMEEAYLVAGKYIRFEHPCEPATAEVYLFSPDTSLASTYLEATCRYLDMYSAMIGPYAYEKFALVENFWQTGYGMPSFTLLGSVVIRLPFIVHTSYGHEILHNWWGNGVYVDWDSGNWCEGLTSYLADHYYKELAGQGAEHRQKLLLNYAWYAAGKSDFPLREFTERSSSSTEAIGYGKAAMLFHMLRRMLGDDLFFLGLQGFWEEMKFKHASWDDIAEAFSDHDLSWFFHQWVDSTGAPKICLESAHIIGNAVFLVLRQSEPVFSLEIPIRLTSELDGEPRITTHRIPMSSVMVDTTIATSGTPVEIAVDPDFDVFRLLLDGEAPTGLGMIFGADTTLLLSSLGDEFVHAVRDKWPTEGVMQLCSDEDLPAIVSRGAEGNAVLGIGPLPKQLHAEAPEMAAMYHDLSKADDAEPEALGDERTVVLAARMEASRGLCWIIPGKNTNPAVLLSITRKLAHYGAYNFLSFEGTRCKTKKRWKRGSNPMVVLFGDKGGAP